MNRILFSVALFLAFSVSASAAVCSRVTSFSDGDVLFASDLNDEYNNGINCVNSISNDNITNAAAIDPKKLSSTIAGSGLVRNGTTGVLSASVDDSTIEISSNALQLKADGTTNAKLADMAALTVKANATNATANPQDVAAASNGQVFKREGDALVFDTIDSADFTAGAVNTAALGTASVTQEKLAARATGTSVAAGGVATSSSCGTSTTTSSSFADITNLSVTITTTGRPIMIMLQGSSGTEGHFRAINSGDDTANMFVRFVYESSTSLCRFFQNSEAGGATEIDFSVPAGSFNCVKAIAAGTHTIRAQFATTAGTSAQCRNAELVAYEL